jgi:hypothetical protein
MNTAADSPLDRQLALLKESVADAAPPESTDRAVAAAIARAQRSPRRARSRRERWLVWPLALAACIAVLSIVVRSLPPDPVDPAPGPTANGNDFLPVVPIADIERAGDAVLVPAKLPRTTLAQLGLPINPARAADAIDTELLVRRDGAVLAVRFVY